MLVMRMLATGVSVTRIVSGTLSLPPLVATAFRPAGMNRKKLPLVIGSPARPLSLAPLDQVKFMALPELLDQLTGAAPAAATKITETRIEIPRVIEWMYATVCCSR